MSIPSATVLAMERLTGYMFQNTDHLWLALQAAGSSVWQIGGVMVGSDGNKRLALLGDKTADLVILTVWYRNAGQLGRELATNRLNTITSNANLNAVGQNLGLGDYIKNNPSAGNRIAPRVMADTVEAVLGAIFLDSGNDLSAVEAAMRSMGLI